MDRRDFIKKATMAAAATAVISPVSAMINTVAGNHCKVIFLALWSTGGWKYWKLWAKGKIKEQVLWLWKKLF